MTKIQKTHLEKPAYIYIRQSTMAQVRHHQESTERQYALEAKARELGWKEVRVLDGDLGISGAQMAGRNDFKVAYAGAYVHGRYQSVKDIAPDGTFLTRVREAPMESWTVLIRDHHEGYISWETFMENKELLERNRTNGQTLAGPAREGHALLQGLLICGSCGRRVMVRYTGSGGSYPFYDCNWQRREGLSTTPCLTVRCDLLDGPFVARLL